MAQPVQQRQYKRFTAAQRFEHSIVILTFIGLAVTGLPQKYASEGWAQTLLSILGGIESVRIIHRFMATLLLMEAIYHGGVISYKLFVLGYRAIMLPTLRDLYDMRDWVLFNLGWKTEHPHLPRYNFGEKAEYLAVVWGTLLMAITGFMMWNPVATAKLLPGEFIPAARAAHGGEALLAVLSIITWHMYNVHVRRFNRAMFTGKASRAMMEEEHGEELEQIEAGHLPPPVPEAVLMQRKRLFWPYALVMATVLISGLIWFITFEDTSITTVPRRQVVVFAPNVQPETADPAVGAALWPTLRCARCHGDDASGTFNGVDLRGVGMSFDEFYEQIRGGTQEMPAFSREEISDGFLLHLWAWLREQDNAS